MKLIARMALKDGMIIGEDVYSYQNILIVKEGTIVNRQVIHKLARYSIMCVAIKEPSDTVSLSQEKPQQSVAFKQFENTYMTNLGYLKQMMDGFLAGKTPINTTFLLKIHYTIKNTVNSNEQFFSFLSCLNIKESDKTYAQFLNGAIISHVFGSWLLLSEDDLKTLTLCGFLYDIGKLKLPNSLVWKTEKLNSFEYNWLKTHTTLGYDLLKKENLNASIINCTLNHHERCDGSGYPNKIKEPEIDRFSKYIAIVDDYMKFYSYQNNNAKSRTADDIINYFKQQGESKYDNTALQFILEGVSRL